MSEGDNNRRGTRNILITGNAKNNKFFGIKSRNADVHIEIAGAEATGNTFHNVDMGNSPEWEEARQRFKQGLLKMFIVSVASAVVAGGVVYALGWT